MKKLTCLVCGIVLAFGLCACGGDTNDVATHEVASDLYTQEEITAAMDTIKTEFKDWKGCTLKELYYAGDGFSEGHQDWADRNDEEEAIVLLSSFDVDSSGGPDRTLNPDSTYTDWMWILVRSSGGPWKHVDHGYG